MNKKILTTLFILLLLPLIGSFNVVKTSALINNGYDYYPYGCNISEYEVSYIENDGSLTSFDCHSSFNNAYNQMKELGSDYVVRSYYSYSPTKIVAMINGRAYAYPGRKGSITLDIYRNMHNDSADSNAIVIENSELVYLDTTYMSTKDAFLGTGYIKIIVNGYEGYTDLEYTDLVPSKYIENKIPIILGGNNVYNYESPYQITLDYSYYKVEDKGNYTDLVYSYFLAIPEKDGKAINYNLRVDNGKEYSFMNKNQRYYSANGFDYYSSPNLNNVSYVGRRFNYYQFLPMRSKSNIPANKFDEFLINIKGSNTNSIIKGKGQTFINAQNDYGMNALLIYAMACNESSYGTSFYATDRNNLFGWNAFDGDPNQASCYSSVDKCINQQMGLNLLGFMDLDDYRYYGSYLGNKGNGFNVLYASDPIWGLKISSIAYLIDKYSCNNNGSLTDYGTVNYGYLLDNSIPLYFNNTQYSISSLHDDCDFIYTAIVYGYDNDSIKLASSNPVVDNQYVHLNKYLINYDFSSSINQTVNSNVEMLYGNKIRLKSDDVEHELFISLRDLSIENNALRINGIGLISGYNYSIDDSIKHYLKFTDLNDSSNVISFETNNYILDDFSLNDGYDYSYVGFDADIDLSELTNTTYTISLVTSNLYDSKEANLRTSELKYRNYNYEDNGIIYHISTNDLFNYRVEFDIYNNYSDIDYSLINKPSYRNSLAIMDLIDIKDDELSIDGHGMIHYLDYNDEKKSYFDLYLYNDSNEIYKLNTITYACELPYTELYDSSYDLTNICFKASGNVSDLSGKYSILLKINNGDYVDLVEFNNRSNSSLYNCGLYEFLTSNIRYRIYFNAKGE